MKMKNDPLRQPAIMLLDAVANTSMKLDHKKITKVEARVIQQNIAKKVVGKFGLGKAFGAVGVYKHTLLDAMKDGKLVITMEKDGKKSNRLIDCYSHGIDEYFRRWPGYWGKVNREVKKRRAEKAKKAVGKGNK